jgi:hypothetical protein
MLVLKSIRYQYVEKRKNLKNNNKKTEKHELGNAALYASSIITTLYNP